MTADPMIMDTSPPGTDECPDCLEHDRFCAAHLREFVGRNATTQDQHRARLEAVREYPRAEADEKLRRADADLERHIRRILKNRPRDMARLLLLAVEVHESRSESIMLDLSAALDPRGHR